MSNLKSKPPCGQATGYDYVADTEGFRYAVSELTGEVVPSVTLEVPAGTTMQTPDEQQRRREQEEKRKILDARKNVSDSLGGFYFVLSGEQFKEISPASVARLIYLNTYARYEDNQLMLTERTSMKSADLIDVLSLSKAQTYRFRDEVQGRYLYENDSGLYFTDWNVFKRGKLRVQNSGSWYQKIYVENVRKLYHATDGKNHKHLGYLFQMLPFVNVEFNMLCHNPTETDLDAVEPMTLLQFCEAIGYDFKNVKRLLWIYKELTFDVHGRQERFCSIIGNGLDLGASIIYVNPNIIYSGTNFDRVQVLGKFCAV